MAQHATVVRIARLTPVAGRESELEELARHQAQEVSKEPGCFGAQACRSSDESRSLVVISRWESQSALEAFDRSDRMQTIRGQSRDILSGPAKLEEYTSLQS